MGMNLRGRLCISTFDDNAIESIRDWEMGMEINHTCVSEWLDDKEKILADIKADMESAGVKVGGAVPVVLHGPFTEIIPAGIDKHMREAGLDRLNQGYEICQALGVKKMIVHNGWVPFMYFREWQAEKAPKFWEAFMANKPADFEIAIENVLEDEPYVIREMMENIRDPRIGLCLDVGHMNAMMNDDFEVEDWIKLLSPWIKHLHLHNNDGENDTHSSFDEGSLDMEDILAFVERYIDDEATISIEAHDCEACLEWLLERRLI